MGRKQDQFNTSLYKRLVGIIVFLRLITPLFILSSVGWVSFLSFMYDWVDSEIFKRAGFTYSHYSTWDKFLDYWWYVFIMIYVLTNNVPGKNIFLILFLTRSVGQLFFYLTQKQYFLFLFPNVLEIFFYFYLFSWVFPFLQPYMNYPKVLWPIGLITVLFVLPREYIIHVGKFNLSGFFTGKTTYWKKE